MIDNKLQQISSLKVILKIKQTFHWIFKNSFNIGFIILMALFIMKNEMSFQFNFNTVKEQTSETQSTSKLSILSPFSNFFEQKDKKEIFETKKITGASSDKNLSNDYSNMTYHELPENVSNISKPGIEKTKKQKIYIKRFAEVARSEMRKYGIPASITLAQGLIESNAGDSRLSIKNNNHFGMKCFSKSCKKDHCSNFTDDSHKDFFRKYNTAWESYRAHSILLGGDRYKHLKRLKKSDYKGWANGLQKAGYATDKKYAQKLIHIIEEMKLYQFDD